MKSFQDSVTNEDLRTYEATPGASLIVRPDLPDFTIVAASNDFIAMTGLKREELIGKSYFQVLHENLDASHLEAKLRASFEYVLDSKQPHDIPVVRNDAPVNFMPKYWQAKNVPVVNDSGAVTRIVHAIVDVTSSVKGDVGLYAKDIEKVYKFFMNAPVIIGYVRGENYEIELANERLLRSWGKTKEVIGKPLFEVIPELGGQGIRQLLDEVRITGRPFLAYERPISFYRNSELQTRYFDFVYQPFYENPNDELASGVISIGYDVTEQVEVRNKFKSLVEQANDPILILKGNDLILEVANEALFRLWNVDRSVIGKKFLEILPEMKDQGFFDLLQRVYKTGEAFHGYEIPAYFEDPNGVKRTFYFNFTYQAYREANGEISGVLVMASDATPQVLAKREVEESQKKWKELSDSMPAIVWTANADGRMTFLNGRWYELTGQTPEQSLDFGWVDALHPDDLSRCQRVWEEARNKGDLYEVEVRYRTKEGDYRWMIARGVPIKQKGEVVEWYGTSTDIREQKQIETQLTAKVRQHMEDLEAKNKLLDNILRNSSNGIAVSEMVFDDAGNVIDALVILANDPAVNYSGIPRELYLTKRASHFDPNIIKSPYGQACLKTLKTGHPSVIQYFLEFSSRWLELTVSKMDNAHLIHIFTDVTPIKNAQIQLEKSLEDLKYANSNLEEFAYAASHDLKEPIRKIQVFSNRLREGLKDKLSADHIDLFSRLENASIRMQNLIDDLLEYSQIGKDSSLEEEVHLNSIIESVLDDLDLEIQRTHARVTVGSLPTISGYKRQMQQLFQNLLSNSLKYGKPGTPPEINITSKLLKGNETMRALPPEACDQTFYGIELSDNGIGFEQKYADTIFNAFMRLESGPEYRGTGIGLSIVRKVVEIHNGFVWAESEPEKGATFTILLPQDTGVLRKGL